MRLTLLVLLLWSCAFWIAPAAAQEAAQEAGDAEPQACPLTTPRFSAQPLQTELAAAPGEWAVLELVLEPSRPPLDFYVSVLVDVLSAPNGGRVETVTGFPTTRLRAGLPGEYRLALRVHLVAKSSCGGIKAAPLLERELTLRVAAP